MGRLRASAAPMLGIVMLGAGLWWSGLPPASLPDAPESLSGFAFSPFTEDTAPYRNEYPAEAGLREDVALLARYGRSLRTYSVDGTLAAVPAIAAEHDLAVTPGIPLDDPASLERHLRTLIRIANANDNVSRVLIGNESLLHQRHTPESLIPVLQRARENLDAAVSTAEPWHIWRDHPELVEQVDYLAVHVLPYWEGVPIAAAVDYVFQRVAELERAWPGKAVVIAEAGWPSNGRARGAAVPSRENAARFVREFTHRAQATGHEYFLMEAFDQPFKQAAEGAVGAYWGVFDAGRSPKFALAGTIGRPVQSALLAAVTALLACLLFGWMARRRRVPDPAGDLLLAGAAALVTFAAVGGLAGLVARYWDWLDAFGALVPLLGLCFAGAVVLIEAYEWAEALSAPERRIDPHRSVGGWPRVSIHVAAYAEPPGMLIATLQSLARLDYPDFEVIVVDNNTRDEALWRPVEDWCRSDPRLRFFHVAPLEGFKAGALNFALEKTHPGADIVAVVDSDYQVRPDWLRDLVPAFDDLSVGVVQAPQAYRDGHVSLFKACCEAEYRGFFDIGMVVRDGRNAIIQHGTMTLIRRPVLAEVGGWAEWTITEDAELGLRVLEHGHRALYTPRCYGAGLTPDNFSDYKAQRYRWAFGAVQILRRHGARLLGRSPSCLSLRQRYEYLAGWLPWIGDAANLLFSVGAVAWSVAMLLAPRLVQSPNAALSQAVMAVFAFKLVKMAVLYRRRVRASLPETAAAALAGLALVYVVGRAVLAGAFSREAGFYRTPKLTGRGRLPSALASAGGETLLSLALLGSAVGVALTASYANIDRQLWCVLLALLAVPPASAMALSLVGAFGAGHGVEARQQRAHQPVHGTDDLVVWHEPGPETGPP